MQLHSGAIGSFATAVGILVFGLTGQPRETTAADPEPQRTEQHPEWIWGSRDRQPGQQVTLSKSFRVSGRVETAKLYLAADFNRCEISLNQQPLLVLDEFAPWIEPDVTENLVAGEENEIRLRCVGGEGPAAIAASLHIHYADGSQAVIRSDESWSAGDSFASDENLSDDGTAATTLGPVLHELWDVDNIARISPFEDYEQWKRASGADRGTDPATFVTRPGFEVDLIRSAAPDEGSWVSLAIDPQGRFIIAKEDRGLLRMTPTRGNPGGAEHADEETKIATVESINDDLQECRGLALTDGALYVNANNSKVLVRLRDTDGDDRYDQVERLREFPGGVGHGRNDLTIGPDGMIYSIHGDAVDVPVENILDHTSPLRRARSGEKSAEGHFVRTDSRGRSWELIASGLRNPFGIDFNADGECFTYDADNEYDMGSPWYRPTRLVHLVSGGDYGWRRKTNGEWPPYFPDHADNALPAIDVGKGSPTAVKFGGRSSFPAAYQRALFALDWAYGRILACHLSPRGAGYHGRVETFLAGRPLNVTDLDFGPAGHMYLVTGGRKTKSALYRIRYVGPDAEPGPASIQRAAREAYSAQQRHARHQIERLHRDPVSTAPSRGRLAGIWSQLSHPDPTLRYAARVAVEHHPVPLWRERALSESDPELAVTALMALARARDPADAEPILNQLADVPVNDLSAFGKLSMIRTYRLLLDDPRKEASGTLASDAVASVEQRLLDWLKRESGLAVAPLGSGDSVDMELARLVADRHIPGAVHPLATRLRRARGQRDRMNLLYMLCHQRDGWSDEDRVVFFEALRQLERTAFAGAGMPTRLAQIRRRAVENLTDRQRAEFSEWIEPAKLDDGALVAISRPFVKRWTLDEIVSALDGIEDEAVQIDRSADPERGRALFRDVLCASCHRIEGRGGVLGPDLTSLASRFSTRDILASIVRPSDVIAEKYRGTQVITIDGKVVSGQVVTGGDYRSPILKIATDPLDPESIVEIPKEEIEMHRPSKISPMPEGLLDTLTAEEVADLMAYLVNRRSIPNQ